MSADAFDPTDAVGEDKGEDENDPRTRPSVVNTDFLGEYGGLSCRWVHFELAGPAEDGPAEIEAVAYYPEGVAPEDPVPRPFVLAVHGGPMAYDEPVFDLDGLVHTARGYVVWRVTYRGSTSHGREFCETLRRWWNSVGVTDLLTEVDTAVDRGVADPDCLFVTGFSRDGVNTAYCLTETDRFTAVVPEHGISQVENHDIDDPDRASHRLDELVSWFRRHDPVVEE